MDLSFIDKIRSDIVLEGFLFFYNFFFWETYATSLMIDDDYEKCFINNTQNKNTKIM